MASRNQISGSGNISNSEEAISVTGSQHVNITIKKHQSRKSQPLALGPDERYNGFVELAKRVYGLLGEKYSSFWTATGVLSSLGILLGITKPQIWFISFVQLLPVDLTWPLAFLILTLALSLGMLMVLNRATCPKCRTNFALREVYRDFVTERRLRNEIVRNEKVFEKCINCGYADNYVEVIRTEIEE